MFYSVVYFFRMKHLIGGSSLLLFVTALFGFTSNVHAAPLVTITSPNGGETFYVGEERTITWNSTNVDMVTIGYLYGDTYSTGDWIAYNIPNTGSYKWKVNVGTTSVSQSRNVKIQIIAYQTGVGSVVDMSDASFTVIKSVPTSVKLITTANSFSTSSVLENFNTFSGSGTLTTQLQSKGIIFSSKNGFKTLYANKYIGAASTAPTLPGAPTGMTGTEITFTNPVKRAGLYIQSGSPFNKTKLRPNKSIFVTAHDVSGAVVLQATTTTCATGVTSCVPRFIGFESLNGASIKKVSYIPLEAYSMSMDNLMFEPRVATATIQTAFGTQHALQGKDMTASSITVLEQLIALLKMIGVH